MTALGLKDDRIRRLGKSHSIVLIWRLSLRSTNTLFLLLLALPGLTLWLPVFITTAIYVRRQKNSGPISDTYDEVAEIKMRHGFYSGMLVWIIAVLVALRIFHLGFFITIWIIPAWMWVTLRWTEGLVSACRAAIALYRMLRTGKAELQRTSERRLELQGRVMEFATHTLGLPIDPKKAFLVERDEDDDGFDLRRRKKR